MAGSGDRKTTADNEALWPIRSREKNLREQYDREFRTWFVDFDPVLDLYTGSGTYIGKVDNASDSSATERASFQLASGASAILRVSNWFPNGSKVAYSVLPTFIDNVVPSAIFRSPSPSATGVDADAPVHVQFSEAVTGVSGSTLALRDAANNVRPATVTYNPATRMATLQPWTTLAGFATYRVTASSSIAASV